MIKKGIISPFTEIHAGPFVSTVGKLSQYGWTFETSYQPYDISTRFFGRSNYGVFSTYIDDVIIKHTIEFPFLHFPREAVLNVKYITERIEMPALNLMPVDVAEIYPNKNHSAMELMYYERKQITVPEKNDVLITPEDIPDLLLKIQEAQKPRAREILAAQRSRNKLKEYQVQAKILSFGT